MQNSTQQFVHDISLRFSSNSGSELLENWGPLLRYTLVMHKIMVI